MAKQLGKYEIIRVLGQGAMGEVYLANHPTIGREVAIKTILPSAARGDDAEGRFRREATAAGTLNHPNLVTIYDFDRDGDILYLVMEYVKGDDLEDLIRQRALSQSQFLEVLAQVCDGLSYAHRNGIIHRDIKPANVRVTQDGKRLLAKVMDFGIARMEDSNLTATGLVMGTVSYMPPEYIQSGKTSAIGDLWAVGVMLYECISGQKPFPGDNTTTILFKIVSDTPKPIDPDLVQGISPSIRNILEMALCKDPAQRFQNADDFGKALRACKDPSWTGTLEEATAMIARRKEEMTPPQPDGTVLLTPSQVMASPAAPTAMMPALPRPAEPTAMAPPRASSVPSLSPAKGSKAGLYAVAATGLLLLVGGGGWYAMRGRKAPEPVVSVVSSAPPPAPSVVQPLAAVAEEPPKELPKDPPPETRKPISVPGPIASQPEPKRELPKAPEKPPEPTPAEKLATAVPLIATEPLRAAGLLKGITALQPADFQAQGNYLAALYRSRNAGEFERAYGIAKANGITVSSMLKVPAFKDAIQEERRLQKDKSPSKVLSEEMLLRIAQDIR